MSAEPPAEPPPLTLRQAANRLGLARTARDVEGFDGKIKRGGRVLIPADRMLDLLDFLTDWSGLTEWQGRTG